MEGKDARRRFVQSTLFPHKESTIKAVEDCGGDREEPVAEEEEDEEWCGSSKKRRETKKKGNSKQKTTPRASLKKEVENGKETSTKQIDVSNSPVNPKSSFFVKVSEQRQRKRQQNQLVSVDAPEEIDEICSSPSSAANGRSTPQKQKQQKKSTPRKERKTSTPSKKMKSGKRELQFDHIPFDLPLDEQPLQKLPDLRLEAKLTAQENSRIFAGRQIHPFFMSRKGGKTSQALTDSESNWSSLGRKEKGIAFNPIHVFENVQDDHYTFNWGHWIFSERGAISDLQCGSSPVFEGSIDSLNFDNYLNVSHFTTTSLNQNSYQCSTPPKELSSKEKDSHMLPKCMGDVLAGSVESVLQDHKHERNDFVNGIHFGENLDPELQEKLLQERIMSHYHTSHNQPENCLWTDKYRPQNAKQICGNGESVNFLSEWLHLWHQRGSLIIRGCTDEDNSAAQDVDCDYHQSESDNDDGEESLKNVLLVTGPVGSGKSAAIYACARDQGFQIIEINASDWRNGALVKQRFGEAVESHWLQRTVENGTNTDNKSLSKFFKAVNADTQCSDDTVIELIHLPDEEDSRDACSSPKKSVSAYKRTVNCQNGVKTLILFEDVDATLSEDHGFITTIQQLAETAKRPMILTSNSDNPALPKSLDRLELSFSLPSVEELLGLVDMICAAEKANIHPYLLQRFVDYCQGDIRRTILLLQFWCQGQALRTGTKQPTTYWPVPFDLDAGHYILPKIIHWDCPLHLSELVAVEVAKSLTLMEETKSVMGQIKVDELNCYSTENMCMQKLERDPIKVKKEAMLSLQSLDEVECTLFEADPELFDISCSPVAFSQKNSRRKVNTVLSSDSEDEFACGSIPLISAGEVHEMKNTSHCLSTEIHQTPAEPVCLSEVNKLEEDCCQLPEIVDYSYVEDSCRSPDMSFMPESSFVPETEIVQETELFSTTVTYGNFFNGLGSNCIFQDQDSIPILETAAGAQSSKSLHILHNGLEMAGNDFDAVTACGYQEEVGDSLSKSEVDVPRGFQLLDECSRVDFVRKLKSLDYAAADQQIDIVKETWKSLHNQCGDFKKYVTAEERTASQVLIFSHGISNLISEADLLLKDCNTLSCESCSSMIPSENTHSYGYYDTQLEMSSILAQHGMCFYAREIASLESIMGCRNNLDLASEMLSSSASSAALGKLASQDGRKANRSRTETNKNSIILSRSSKSDSALHNILQTVVPSKSYLTAKGGAFHEYISTLSQISRYETSRLSECIDSGRKRRRARVPPHYLSSGSLSMSSEEISSLGRHISYRKVPSLDDENLR
ncbi:hypothetical protein C2S51_007963 [Perilla frutescens var. frutescens]|nr:hypothetical protein C2S51_007963 [Perilla frutescens var. frutescens]